MHPGVSAYTHTRTRTHERFLARLASQGPPCAGVPVSSAPVDGAVASRPGGRLRPAGSPPSTAGAVRPDDPGFGLNGETAYVVCLFARFRHPAQPEKLLRSQCPARPGVGTVARPGPSTSAGGRG